MESESTSGVVERCERKLAAEVEEQRDTRLLLGFEERRTQTETEESDQKKDMNGANESC